MTEESTFVASGVKIVLDVPGLDVTAGLHYVGGRMSTYLTILRMFAEQQGDVVGEIRRALDSGDQDTALHVAHGAKGILGTIGARQLYEESEVLYQALRDACPRDGIELLLQGFQARHDVLVAALNAQLPADTPE